MRTHLTRRRSFRQYKPVCQSFRTCLVYYYKLHVEIEKKVFTCEHLRRRTVKGNGNGELSPISGGKFGVRGNPLQRSEGKSLFATARSEKQPVIVGSRCVGRLQHLDAHVDGHFKCRQREPQILQTHHRIPHRLHAAGRPARAVNGRTVRLDTRVASGRSIVYHVLVELDQLCASPPVRRRRGRAGADRKSVGERIGLRGAARRTTGARARAADTRSREPRATSRRHQF